MRLILKLFLYTSAIVALHWLVPQIAGSLNRATEAASTADASRGYALFSIYLIVGAAFAVILARDTARFFGALAGSLFVGGGSVARSTPALWKAERLRQEGNPHGAVDVLHHYLDLHPREWPVAVRLADIYQKDLKDPLLAALEYEKVLDERPPTARRAEIMLRLAACYLLLRDPEQSAAMLQQVIEQFPGTPAAEKAARRRARMTAITPATDTPLHAP